MGRETSSIQTQLNIPFRKTQSLVCVVEGSKRIAVKLLHGCAIWIAQSQEEAEALLAHALTLAFQHPPRIRVPVSNQRALELVQAYGFREIRAFKHMRRGGIQPPQQRENIYALATAAIG